MFATRSRLRTLLALLVALGSAAIVLAERTGQSPVLQPVALLLLDWAVALSGVALLVGVLNVLWVHLRRVQRGQAGWGGSLLLVVALAAVAVVGLMGNEGERTPLVEWVYDAVIAPGAGTLIALIAVFLLGAIYYQVRVGKPGAAWVMAGLLIMLVAQTPATRALLAPESRALAAWLFEAPVAAIFRGALLGVALASLVVGVRWLLRRSP